MKTNQISADLTTLTVDQIMEKIDEIGALLPFLISLTLEERSGGFKPGDVNIAWLSRCRYV